MDSIRLEETGRGMSSCLGRLGVKEVIHPVYEQTQLESQSLEVNMALSILDAEIWLLIHCKNSELGIV